MTQGSAGGTSLCPNGAPPILAFQDSWVSQGPYIPTATSASVSYSH